MASGDAQAAAFVRQFSTWWPYAGLVVVGAVFGGIGLILGPAGAVAGVLFSLVIVIWAAWSAAGRQLQDEQLRAWSVGRELTFRDRAVVPGATRLLRAGRYRTLNAGADGQPAGGRVGVAFYSWTVTVGQNDTTSEATLAWASVPSLAGLQRLYVAAPIPGRRLRDAFGPLRLVTLGPPQFQERFAVEVNDDADDAVVQRLFTPELIDWFLDRHDPAPWVEVEGRLLVVVRSGRTADPRVLDELLARVEHLAAAWRQAQG